MKSQIGWVEYSLVVLFICAVIGPIFALFRREGWSRGFRYILFYAFLFWPWGLGIVFGMKIASERLSLVAVLMFLIPIEGLWVYFVVHSGIYKRIRSGLSLPPEK